MLQIVGYSLQLENRWVFSSGNRAVLGDTCSYLLGELLGEYHKIETIKTLNIYISTYGAIIRLFTVNCFSCDSL